MINAAMNKEAEQKRLIWRCRRGLLELDIMLAKFTTRQAAAMTDDQMHALDSLLAMPDNQFLDLLLKREATRNNSINQLLEDIRNAQH